eukprot:COSAG06_NODE_37837_length_430_cov_1.525680_1_plen_32_part_01
MGKAALRKRDLCGDVQHPADANGGGAGFSNSR